MRFRIFHFHHNVLNFVPWSLIIIATSKAFLVSPVTRVQHCEGGYDVYIYYDFSFLNLWVVCNLFVPGICVVILMKRRRLVVRRKIMYNNIIGGFVVGKWEEDPSN